MGVSATVGTCYKQGQFPHLSQIVIWTAMEMLPRSVAVRVG
jgi:hypothetical protein